MPVHAISRIMTIVYMSSTVHVQVMCTVQYSLDNANTVCLKFILFFMISFEKKKKSYLPAKFENALFFDDGKV